MKQGKRIVSLLLILVMSLGIFAGCKKEEEDTGKKGSNKITVGIPQETTIPDYDTNAYSLYLEEVTGLNIEWVFFSSAASYYQQQLTLMCTGGEKLPEVIIGMRGLSYYVVNQLGEDGYLLDLTDLIKDYAPNYNAQIEKLDKDMQYYIQERGKNSNDGAQYAMAQVMAHSIDSQQSMMYINKTWLDKLGLQAPKNVTELKNVCRAFMTQDPNGNGEADEIAMLGGADLRYWLLNAYVEYNATTGYNVKDGKLWDPVVSDEFRQGLIFINDLVKEGLYSDLGFTLTLSEMRNLISPINGVGKVGIFCGHHESLTNSATDALDHYIALDALADETGKGGYYIINEPDVSWANFITKDCKDTKKAMKFLDALYSDESVSRERHGVKDEDWYYEEGKNSMGTDSYVNIINGQPWNDPSLNKTLRLALGIQNHWNYLAVAAEGEGRVAQSARLVAEGWNLMQNGKKQEGDMGKLVYTQEEFEIREEKAGSMQNYVNSQITLFMKGDPDPRNDASWNEFKDTLQQIGRAELMKVAQDAYSRKMERQ